MVQLDRFHNQARRNQRRCGPVVRVVRAVQSRNAPPNASPDSIIRISTPEFAYPPSLVHVAIVQRKRTGKSSTHTHSDAVSCSSDPAGSRRSVIIVVSSCKSRSAAVQSPVPPSPPRTLDTRLCRRATAVALVCSVPASVPPAALSPPSATSAPAQSRRRV